jgi:hypothetical protein
MRKLVYLIFILPFSLFAQSKSKWTDHFSYNDVKDVEVFGDKIIANSTYGLILFDRVDNSISKFTKIQGLIGEEISSFNANYELGLIVVGYIDGSFSIIDQNSSVFNVYDIKNSSITGKKTINDFAFYGDKLFIASEFGIVEYNLSKYEFGDTFVFGENGSYIKVNEVFISKDEIFAATNSGVYTADLKNQLLIDYNNWTRISDLPIGEYNSIAILGDNIYANQLSPIKAQYRFDNVTWSIISNYSDFKKFKIQKDNITIIRNSTIEIYDINFNVIDEFKSTADLEWQSNSAVFADGEIFIASKSQGVLSSINEFKSIKPTGPYRNDAFRINAYNDNIYVSYGSHNDIYGPRGKLISPDVRKDSNWEIVNVDDISRLRDIIEIVENPNDPSNIFYVSWGYGVVEVKGDEVFKYNHENSGLQKLFYFDPNYVSMRIGGAAFDDDGNVWFANGWNVEFPFVVKTPESKWYSYNLTTNHAPDYGMSNIHIDQYGNKWVATKNDGVWAFNERKSFDDTSDDESIVFGTNQGRGSLPISDVRTMAIDKDNIAWFGTAKGLVFFNDVANMYELSSYDAQPVIINDNGEGAKFLGDLRINKIVVDGGNNKWFGTESAGVYYTNFNAQKTIYHFTKDNSPLPSNMIFDIAIDDESGEVYILTSKGLISFRGDASKGADDYEDLIVYPNPVKPGYTGEIRIKGLSDKSNIKITDINSNVLYETTSSGGMAKWNGKSFDGSYVGSGVYLIFVLSEDGQKSAITKLLIVR